jgi:hypothetical protein
MNKILLITCFLITSIFSGAASAAKPVCHSSHGGYCGYKGKVKRVYVNTANEILMYFEQPIALADAEVAGYTISKGAAGVYKITDNPDFAKMLYSTLLAATSQDRVVSVQMRGVTNGYLTIDRIWFGE